MLRDVLVHNSARTSAFVMKDTSSKASVEWDEASIITSRHGILLCLHGCAQLHGSWADCL